METDDQRTGETASGRITTNYPASDGNSGFCARDVTHVDRVCSFDCDGDKTQDVENKIGDVDTEFVTDVKYTSQDSVEDKDGKDTFLKLTDDKSVHSENLESLEVVAECKFEESVYSLVNEMPIETKTSCSNENLESGTKTGKEGIHDEELEGCGSKSQSSCSNDNERTENSKTEITEDNDFKKKLEKPEQFDSLITEKVIKAKNCDTDYSEIELPKRSLGSGNAIEGNIETENYDCMQSIETTPHSIVKLDSKSQNKDFVKSDNLSADTVINDCSEVKGKDIEVETLACTESGKVEISVSEKSESKTVIKELSELQAVETCLMDTDSSSVLKEKVEIVETHNTELQREKIDQTTASEFTKEIGTVNAESKKYIDSAVVDRETVKLKCKEIESKTCTNSDIGIRDSDKLVSDLKVDIKCPSVELKSFSNQNTEQLNQEQTEIDCITSTCPSSYAVDSSGADEIRLHKEQIKEQKTVKCDDEKNESPDAENACGFIANTEILSTDSIAAESEKVSSGTLVENKVLSDAVVRPDECVKQRVDAVFDSKDVKLEANEMSCDMKCDLLKPQGSKENDQSIAENTAAIEPYSEKSFSKDIKESSEEHKISDNFTATEMPCVEETGTKDQAVSDKSLKVVSIGTTDLIKIQSTDDQSPESSVSDNKIPVNDADTVVDSRAEMSYTDEPDLGETSKPEHDDSDKQRDQNKGGYIGVEAAFSENCDKTDANEKGNNSEQDKKSDIVKDNSSKAGGNLKSATIETKLIPQLSPHKRKYRKRKSIVYKSKPKTKPIFKAAHSSPMRRSQGKRNLTIRELLQRPSILPNNPSVSGIAANANFISNQMELNTVQKQGDSTLNMVCIGELPQTFPVVTPVVSGVGGAIIPPLAQMPIQTVPSGDNTFPLSHVNQVKCDANMKKQLEDEDKIHEKLQENSDMTELVKKTFKLKSYRCLGCPYNSAIKTNIRRHVAHHINYKPYFCDSCKTVSSDKSVIAFHVKQKHGFFEKGFSSHLVPEVENIIDNYLEQCVVHTDKKGDIFHAKSNLPIDQNKQPIRFKDCPLKTFDVFKKVVKNPSVLPTREKLSIDEKHGEIGVQANKITVKKRGSGGKNISTLLAERDAARDAKQQLGVQNLESKGLHDEGDSKVYKDPYQLEESAEVHPTFLLVYPDKSTVTFDEKRGKNSNFADWQMYQRKMKQLAKLNRSASVETKRKRGRPNKNPYCIAGQGNLSRTSELQGNDSGILWDIEEGKVPQTKLTEVHNPTTQNESACKEFENKKLGLSINVPKPAFLKNRHVASSPSSSFEELSSPPRKKRRFSKPFKEEKLLSAKDLQSEMKQDILLATQASYHGVINQKNETSSSKSDTEFQTGLLEEMVEVKRRGRKKVIQMEEVNVKQKESVGNILDIQEIRKENKNVLPVKPIRKRKGAADGNDEIGGMLSKRRKVTLPSEDDNDSLTVTRRKSPNKKWGPGGVCLCEEGHPQTVEQNVGKAKLGKLENDGDGKFNLTRSGLRKNLSDYYKRKYNHWQKKKPTPLVSKEKSLINCPFCSSVFSSVNGMRRHAFWKHRMCKFQCTECDYWSTFKPDAVDHFKKQHAGKTVKIHRNFSLPVDVQEEIAMPLDKKESGEKKEEVDEVSCCKTRTPLKSQGTSSSLVCSSGDNTQMEIEFETTHTPKQGGIGTCPYCGFKSTVRGVGFHLMQRHNICFYRCSKCDYKSTSRIKAQHHVERFHSKIQNISVKKQLVWVMSEDETYEKGTNVEKKDELKSSEKGNKTTAVKTSQKIATEVPETISEIPGKPSSKQEQIEEKTDKPASDISKCFYCDYESTARGVGRHLLVRHNLCDWQCTFCQFKSSSKVKTQNHILKKHPEKKKCDMRKRYIQVKPKLIRDMEDGKDESDKEMLDISQPIEEEDEDLTLLSTKVREKMQGLKSKAWALKIKSLKRMQLSKEKEKMQQILASKRRRNLLDINMDGEISYTLHPKRMECLEVGFSCVYCHYAAPLRHQLRLHCYDKHTNFPACLMEFTCDMAVTPKGRRSKGGKSVKVKTKKVMDLNPMSSELHAPKGSQTSTQLNNEGSKVFSPDNVGESIYQAYTNIISTGDAVSNKPGKEADLDCVDAKGGVDSKSDSLGDKPLNEVSGSNSSCNKLLSTDTKKGQNLRKFCNPLIPLIGQLGACKVKVSDAFHSSLDDIDSVLSSFGVRTLNMDMLTSTQFSNFMSRFGNNLQQM